MKKTNVYRAGAFLLGGLLMAACAEPLIEQKPAEELTLKASAESVVLDQLAEQDEALRLTWGAGSNEGTGAAIRYTLEMDLAGNDFAGGMKDSLGKTDVHFMAFSHGELNDTILTEYWDIDPAEEKEYAFEARVIADVASPLVAQQVSNVVSFKLTTYKRRYLNLYLIGDAAPNGWDMGRAALLMRTDGSMDQFTWTGELKAGGFKFICQNTDGRWWPGYVCDPSADPNVNVSMAAPEYTGKLAFHENDPGGENDIKFLISTPGKYTIYLNTATLEIKCTLLEMGDPQLFLIGPATDADWSLDAIGAYEMDYADKTFTWEGELNAGELRFVCQQSSFWPGYVKDALNENKVKYYTDVPPDGEDLKFNIPAAGTYRIILNIETLDISIEPTGGTVIPEDPDYSQVWVIGSATENGWSWDNMPAMAQDAANPDVFTWTGALKEGNIKFPLDKSQGPFVGDCVVAKVNKTPIGTDLDFDIENLPENPGELDRQWHVSADQAGTYTIRLDFGTKKISFTKQ